MTSFAKKWTPPTTLNNGDNAAWASVTVALWNDICVNMVAAGLVQTSDTGQLDFSTVTGPGAATTTRTVFGYRMYTFNDALQATAPIFIKLTFGAAQLANSTAALVNRGQTILVEIGTGSNGSGTLTNTIQSTYFPTSQNGGSGSSWTYRTAQISAICYNEGAGFFGMSYYPGVSTTNTAPGFSMASFFIQRSTDASFTPTADGFCIYMPNQGGPISASTPAGMSSYYYSYASGLVGLISGTDWAPRIGGVTNSVTPTGPSMQRTWMLTPYVKEYPNLLTYSVADVSFGTEMSINDNGVIKNFVALSNLMGAYPSSVAGGLATFAMRFE